MSDWDTTARRIAREAEAHTQELDRKLNSVAQQVRDLTAGFNRQIQQMEKRNQELEQRVEQLEKQLEGPVIVKGARFPLEKKKNF